MKKATLVSKVNSVVAPAVSPAIPVNKKEEFKMTNEIKGFITIGEMFLYKKDIEVIQEQAQIERKKALKVELEVWKQEAKRLLDVARKSSGVSSAANNEAKEIAFGASPREKGESRCSAYLRKLQEKAKAFLEAKKLKDLAASAWAAFNVVNNAVSGIINSIKAIDSSFREGIANLAASAIKAELGLI